MTAFEVERVEGGFIISYWPKKNNSVLEKREVYSSLEATRKRLHAIVEELVEGD